MMLIKETIVPDAVLPVEEFKAHLRLGSGFANESVQDAVLASFLRAAVAAIEARTGKVLIERDFCLSLTAWQSRDAHVLPIGPVWAVNGLTLVDRAGVQTPVDGDTFWLDRDTQVPRLRSVGNNLPAVPHAGRAEVAFRAGFAPTVVGAPADLVQAVMLLAAHFYEFRHETTLSAGCMPFGVTSLIERYKPVRLGGVGV